MPLIREIAMQIIVKSSVQAASEAAAQLLQSQIRKKPESVLGLSTGSTPVKLYAELVRLHQEEGLDFSAITTFNLDEYLGTGPDHPGSFHRFMQEHLFSLVNIEPSRIHIPDGMTPDPAEACRQYEESIRQAGGIDIQLLGIGRDGHIGFNEPGSPFGSRTRVESLTALTRRDNAASFSGFENVPEQAITMGIATILEARRIVLMAFGEKKAEILRKALEEPVTPMVPASALQLHGNTLVLADEEAASRLTRVDAV